MSSSTPATSAGTHASTATTRTLPARPGAAQGGSDLFSSLLALLSATHDAPALAADEGAGGSERPGKGLPKASDAPEHNPLAGLLGWPGATPQTKAQAGGEAVPIGAAPAVRLSATPQDTHSQPDPLGTRAAATLQANPAPTQLDASAQGLTLLETPAAPDASTLATLARAGTGEATAKPKTPGSEAATRALAWRSTVGAATGTSTPAPPNGQAAGTDKLPSAHPALLAQTRSTVALDERFGSTQDSETPLAATGVAASAGPATGGQSPGSGSGSPGAAPETHSPDTAAERHEQVGSDTAFADTAREADEMAQAHWGTPQLRHASLRVGEAGEDPIDIQLAMTGQELSVEFRTDSTEARASLAQDAGKSLGDLLQRSGIQLGNVSVGAQSQQQGEPGRAPAPTPSLGRGRPGGENEASAAPAATLRPRLDGSRPLDLFV